MKDFPAVVVANYFVEKGKKEGRPVEGVLKLIKLVYLAHGWHLGIFEKKPLIRERVEAWQYGPVVRSVYDAFKYCGRLKITKPAITGIKEEMEPIENLAEKETIEFLDEVWEIYGKHTGPELSKLTHEERTPWDDTRKKMGMQIYHLGVVIPDEAIGNYYAGRIKEANKETDS